MTVWNLKNYTSSRIPKVISTTSLHPWLTCLISSRGQLTILNIFRSLKKHSFVIYRYTYWRLEASRHVFNIISMALSSNIQDFGFLFSILRFTKVCVLPFLAMHVCSYNFLHTFSNFLTVHLHHLTTYRNTLRNTGFFACSCHLPIVQISGIHHPVEV